MRRNRVKQALLPKRVNGGEKLVLTKQQAGQVLASQQAAQEARERAAIVLDGVLAAKGIDRGAANVTGGELLAAEPFLTIKRLAPAPSGANGNGGNS